MYRKFNRNKKRIINMVWLYVIIYFILSILISIFIGNFLDKFMRDKFLAAINLVIPDYTPILGKKISSDPYVNSVLNDARVKDDIGKIKNAIAKFLSLIFSLIFVFFISSLYFSDKKETGSEKLDVKEKISPKNLEEGAEQIFVQFGPFGDLFNGSLTPLLTFATFTGLLITIIMQHMQMRATLAELQMSRIEMADSTDALQEQVRNSQAQKFDSNFYSMLQFHMNTVELLKSKKNIISNEFNNFNKKGVEWQGFDLPDSFRNFFLINYQILKFVRKHELSGQLSSSEAKQYSNIVRAVIDDDIYGLIFLNCINVRFSKYRELIEHYEFLEHFVFSGFYNPYILKLIFMYKISIFGDKENLFNFLDDKSGFFVSYVFEDKLSTINNVVEIWNSSGMSDFKIVYKNKIDLIDIKLLELLNFNKKILDIIDNFSARDCFGSHDLITSIIDRNDLFLIKNNTFDILKYFELWKEIYELIGLWGGKFKFVAEHIKKIELQLK